MHHLPLPSRRYRRLRRLSWVNAAWITGYSWPVLFIVTSSPPPPPPHHKALEIVVSFLPTADQLHHYHNNECQDRLAKSMIPSCLKQWWYLPLFYTPLNATARIHIDGMESEPFPIKRGVRQGDPISPKLFTAAIEDIFRKAELTDGIDMDGETLTDLRFADDVALLTKTPQQMESQMNTLNNISKTVGLKMHKGKTKFMINYPNQDSLYIENEEIEKVEHYKYLGQTTYLKETTKEEIKCRIRTGWGCFGRNREVFLDEKLPMSLRRQVFDQCVLPSMTYGCQTWSLSKAMGQKLRTAQRAMERKMLNLKIKDKIPYTEIRKRTRVQDIVQFVLKQKWKWAGHVARLDDNRWTQRVTEWQPREGRRSRGRQRKRWRDDLVQLKGVTWRHDAQHRQRWRSDVEGYFQQWRNTAL